MSRRDWTLFVTKIQEASNGIPAENKLLQPDVDCAAIKGLRNRIVHEYFGLSLAVI